MIKQAGIAECDMCGATEEIIAKIGYYHEVECWMPKGWDMEYGKLLCPECLKRKLAMGGENIVESYS